MSVWYDTLRSHTMSDFSAAYCVETNDGTDRTAADTDTPGPGEIWFYLVRAENACPDGLGSLGQGTGGFERNGPDCW